jgi:hypothetical protein
MSKVSTSMSIRRREGLFQTRSQRCISDGISGDIGMIYSSGTYSLLATSTSTYTVSREPPLRLLSTPSGRQSQPELDPESYRRFARVDEGVLTWNFTVKDGRGEAIARVERTFRGVGEEVRASDFEVAAKRPE